LRSLLILSAVLAPLALVAHPTPAPADTLKTVWVEVLDSRGRQLETLGVGDLAVVEDGQEVEVIEVAKAAQNNGRVGLYFDRTLASSRNLKQTAGALGNLAEELVALGVVEVVLAGEEVEQDLATRDALILGQRLARMALTETGEGGILELRRRTLRAVASATPGRLTRSADEKASAVVAAIREELEIVRRSQQDLLLWAAAPAVGEAGNRPSEPRLLFVVSDGFDLDPVSFYAQHLPADAMRGVLRGASELPPLDREISANARALAGLGWTVMPIAFAPVGDSSRANYSAVESRDEEGNSTSGVGVTIRPGDLFKRRSQGDATAEPEAEFVQAEEPLDLLATATGGETVISDSGLHDALRRFGHRFRLTYRSQLPRKADSRSVELRSLRAGVGVRGTRWVSGALPEVVTRIRLERLLNGFEADGGFDVAAVLQVAGSPGGAPSNGQLEARLELRELLAATEAEEWANLDDAVFRVSVAVAGPQGVPQVHQEVFESQTLREKKEWLYRTQLELPVERGEVAVLVEELTRGHWGGRRATVVIGSADFAVADLLPTPTVIEILPPNDPLLRGRVRLATRVIDPAVAEVQFLLGDREVGRVRRPPFAARINLGSTPRRQSLTVVAYDASGIELGRDKAVLNGGSGGLAVEIVRPTKGRGTGRVEVEAEIAVPVERRLDRVLFFWNGEPVATLYGAPFRQWINVPADKPVGYVRVVALLDDGSTAEDVLFMNGPEGGERVDVNLVELYVVVTDSAGRPVRGLTEEDFLVRENGKNQTVATFSDASDLPLTLGMAIDSSASMFIKLPRVQEAAVGFLHSTFSDQDRAFVVDFDSEPRLVRSTTGDLRRLERSIRSLEANGRTAMWESIVFSLVQLQGVRGRKALIVFSDGADEDDKFPFRSLMDISRRMGVPIYLILMKKKPEKEGLSLLVRSYGSRVDRLTEATGGKVFYGREYRDLGEVYDEIERELRSQYLLAYYPLEASQNSAWRSVDVEVKKKGLKTRTLSGYWQ
jgi:Ca-activated chloride channel family protein